MSENLRELHFYRTRYLIVACRARVAQTNNYPFLLHRESSVVDIDSIKAVVELGVHKEPLVKLDPACLRYTSGPRDSSEESCRQRVGELLFHHYYVAPGVSLICAWFQRWKSVDTRHSCTLVAALLRAS